ncbi:hypothetical protein [Fluviispira multicolorata]|uniref:Gcp-like domain-containing protein n=1 Tax=Fluviispira multicolorata TaxID=2654512 RepID=A0A833JEE5_9BACT|nr:hypothetical protein [Fluviispira multicolorata]KAB8033179.1 hypothetical protein GCL57_00345 [Fluviispira multicolorata]
MFSQFEFPFALILTHRRGVGIALFKSDVIFSSSLNELDYYTLIKNSKMTQIVEDNIELLEFEDLIFSRVKGKTAENLFKLYSKTLERFSLKSQEIKTLLVGVGPGSFTGLRLGSAFANGMKMGSPLNLLPVKTFLTPELLQMCRKMSVESEFVEQLGEYEEEDESTGFVTFFDLLASLLQTRIDNREFVESLVPEYGREPGPVIKLNEGLNK